MTNGHAFSLIATPGISPADTDLQHHAEMRGHLSSSPGFNPALRAIIRQIAANIVEAVCLPSRPPQRLCQTQTNERVSTTHSLKEIEMFDEFTATDPATKGFCKKHNIWLSTALNCRLRVVSIEDHAAILGQADIDAPGLVIPHFDIRRTQTGHFSTYVLSDADEPTYMRKAGPSPNFYLCPILDWERVARDPKTSISIVISELNAIKACQQGVPSIAYIGELGSNPKAAMKAAVADELYHFVWGR